MDAAGLLVGADNTTMKMTSGSNFCPRPQNCVFNDGVVAHTAIVADGKKPGKPRTRSHNCTFCHTNRPLPLLDVTGSPIVRDYTMDFQILCTRTNIEPFPVIENNTANLAAGPDPIGDDRNERNFSIRWDPLENLWVPNRDVGEVIIAGHAVSVRDIDQPATAKGDRRGSTGITQRQGNVVSAAEMLVNQRLQLDIR